MAALTCRTCGYTAEETPEITPTKRLEIGAIYRTLYAGKPATIHTVATSGSHVVLDGKCAGLGRWGIGPCYNAARYNGLCGTHANKAKRR